MSNRVAGSILIFVASSLSAAGGVGGGILNVGILLIVWQFSYHNSVILSLATLFGNYSMQVLRFLL